MGNWPCGTDKFYWTVFRWKEGKSTFLSSDVCGAFHEWGVVGVSANGDTHTSGAEDVDLLSPVAFLSTNKQGGAALRRVYWFASTATMWWCKAPIVIM